MIFDRLDAYRRVSGQFGNAAHNGESGALTRSLQFEIDAIQHVYQLAQSPMFARIAERISNADAVYILGIQSTRGISNPLYNYLEYIRPRVLLQ